MKDGASTTVSRASKKAGREVTRSTAGASRPAVWHSLLPPLLLFGLVVALYAPAAGNGFIYDDTEVILHHEGPRTLGELARIFAEPHFPNLPYYRPVTRATLLLQKTWHGEDAAPFHLFNAALMGAAAGLAFLLLRLPAFGIGLVPALLAAGLFAVHPIASSCVYPIASGRETLLPSVWALAAVYGWLRPERGWRVFAIAAFAAGLLSKEQDIVIPVLFGLADLLELSPNPPGRDVRQWSRRYVPIALIVVAYLAVRQALFGGSQYGGGTITGPLYSAFYAVQTFAAPFRELVYEPSLATWWSPLRLAFGVAVVAGIVVAAWKLCAPKRRPLYFWAAWFGITFLPTANLLRQEAFFDERYVFLPSLSVLALAASALSAGWQRQAMRACALALSLVAISSAAISYRRASFFADDVAFSRQWLRTRRSETLPLPALLSDYYVQPAQTVLGTVNAHYNLGYALARRGEYADAITHYTETLRLRPDYAKAHNNLGNALAVVGRTEEAARQLSEALRLEPGYADAHFNLGSLLARQGKLAEGIRHLQEALRLAAAPQGPLQEVDIVAIHLNLANALALSGSLDEARMQVLEALRLRPDSADAHNNLGNILVAMNRLREAADQYRMALRNRPGHEDARRNLDLIEEKMQEEARGEGHDATGRR